MDSRFDVVAKAVGRGATRREALRLMGVGLTGALLAAVGRGTRAGAQAGPPPIVPPAIFTHCVPGVPEIDVRGPGELIKIGKSCGACPEGELCLAFFQPNQNQLLCACATREGACRRFGLCDL